MAETFHIVLTADFLGEDGRPALWEGGFPPLEEAAERASYGYMGDYLPEISAEQIEGADALLCLVPKVTRETLRGAARLKVVARWGVGFDNVDVDACTEAGVAVTITKGAVDHPVAEAIVGFMLALSHRMLPKHRLVVENRWNDRTAYNGTELREKVAGIVGLGGIGRRTLQLLSSFGMERPAAYDPYLGEAEMEAAGARKVELDTLVAEADFLIVTCPLTDETRGLIGARELARAKPSAFLINTARGGIVDEAALEAALKAGQIAGAALDVFEREPTDDSLPLAKLDNVVLSPHSIAWTEELFRDVGRMACGSILDLAEGRKPHGLLNPEVWDTPAFRRKLQLD